MTGAAIDEAVRSTNVYLALAAALINAVFVVLVLMRTSRNALTTAFLRLCLFVATWNFGIFMAEVTASRSWFYVALGGSSLIPASVFHLAATAVQPPLAARRWIIFSYVLAGLLSATSLLAIVHPWARAFVESIGWNVFFLGALMPFMLGGIVVLARARRRTPPGGKRDLVRNVLAAAIIAAVFGLTDLVKIFNVPFPKLGHLGSVIGSSLLAVQIFKNRKSYDVLAQMQTKVELLGELAAGISHEIRNPLGSLKGASQLLAGEIADRGSPQAREYLEILQDEIQRMEAVLANFQHLMRPMLLERTPVSINEILRKTVRLADVGALPLRITTDLATELPAVPADAAAVQQVFLNLVKNAADACGGGGELRVATASQAHGVSVVFRDNGPGIPPEDLERIFTPFVTTKPSGMGLGLAISRRIVAAHQGRIEVANATPRGAEFSVWLPA